MAFGDCKEKGGMGNVVKAVTPFSRKETQFHLVLLVKTEVALSVVALIKGDDTLSAVAQLVRDGLDRDVCTSLLLVLFSR